jgi:hypothetical protein
MSLQFLKLDLPRAVSRHASDVINLPELYGEGQSRLLQKFCIIKEDSALYIRKYKTNAGAYAENSYLVDENLISHFLSFFVLYTIIHGRRQMKQ